MLARREASRQEVSVALQRELAKSKDTLEQGHEWIAAILNECEERGYLSDSRIATNHFATLRRRGSSKRKIEAALQKKGIAEEVVKRLFEAEEESAEESAASRTVARRRFGLDPEKRDKELASLARAGFGYYVARCALDAAAKEEE